MMVRLLEKMVFDEVGGFRTGGHGGAMVVGKKDFGLYRRVQDCQTQQAVFENSFFFCVLRDTISWREIVSGVSDMKFCL
ncbi:hypothetical protein M6B38_159390 [Iris pallida]|uniref:Uncharacterized protein n=1 Tax=Iris pallida TaxID=29817 RepID=A0AAX6F198_IRIPA|nr:hypothetical protein M6B38_159390 [Iris pallida]